MTHGKHKKVREVRLRISKCQAREKLIDELAPEVNALVADGASVLEIIRHVKGCGGPMRCVPDRSRR